MILIYLMSKFDLPPLYKIRQSLEADEIADVTSAVTAALDSPELKQRVRPGMKVAVTAGSRGIDRIDQVLRAVVDWIKDQGAEPFIITAMGSHGGGTEEGRLAVLANLGIDESSMAATVPTQKFTPW